MARELSLFCDESGSEAGGPRYYILALVLHDQSESLDEPIRLYSQSLQGKGLPDIPLHTSPLMNGNEEYKGMEMQQRKSLLMTFLTMFRHLPISYKAFVYASDASHSPADLSAKMRRDLVNFIFDNLEFFQGYNEVKLYYDNGQSVVTNSLHDALGYALAREAVRYRIASQADYRLAQAADLICTVELTAPKYKDGTTTRTDDKVFGTWRSFRENFYKVITRKRFQEGA